VVILILVLKTGKIDAVTGDGKRGGLSRSDEKQRKEEEKQRKEKREKRKEERGKRRTAAKRIVKAYGHPT